MGAIYTQFIGAIFSGPEIRDVIFSSLQFGPQLLGALFFQKPI